MITLYDLAAVHNTGMNTTVARRMCYAASQVKDDCLLWFHKHERRSSFTYLLYSHKVQIVEPCNFGTLWGGFECSAQRWVDWECDQRLYWSLYYQWEPNKKWSKIHFGIVQAQIWKVLERLLLYLQSTAENVFVVKQFVMFICIYLVVTVRKKRTSFKAESNAITFHPISCLLSSLSCYSCNFRDISKINLNPLSHVPGLGDPGSIEASWLHRIKSGTLWTIVLIIDCSSGNSTVWYFSTLHSEFWLTLQSRWLKS